MPFSVVVDTVGVAGVHIVAVVVAFQIVVVVETGIAVVTAVTVGVVAAKEADTVVVIDIEEYVEQSIFCLILLQDFLS